MQEIVDLDYYRTNAHFKISKRSLLTLFNFKLLA